MAKKQAFSSMDIMEEMSAKDLLRLLKSVVALDENAIVTIRQTAGTDFPPFIAVESEETHAAINDEGVYENLLA
jgi:hypothetical protein